MEKSGANSGVGSRFETNGRHTTIVACEMAAASGCEHHVKAEAVLVATGHRGTTGGEETKRYDESTEIFPVI